MRLLIPSGIFLSLLFLSCKQVDRSADLSAAVYSLKQANAYLVSSNRDIKNQLYSEAKNPLAEKRLGSLVPAVKEVGAKTGELCRWIKDLEYGYWGDENATIPAEKLEEFYDRLLSYAKEITDSVAEKHSWTQSQLMEIRQKAFYSLQLVNDRYANEVVEAHSWVKANFKNLSLRFQMAMLIKLENDVLHTEHEILSYLLEQTRSPRWPDYSFEPFIKLDRARVRQGERIALTTGVLACESSWPCVVLINNDTVNSVTGIRQYRTIAGGSGSQKMPVKIMYYHPDGTLASVNKDLKYTVVK